MNKKGWKRLKKVVDQLLGVRSTQKLVEIHNTLQPIPEYALRFFQYDMSLQEFFVIEF